MTTKDQERGRLPEQRLKELDARRGKEIKELFDTLGLPPEVRAKYEAAAITTKARASMEGPVEEGYVDPIGAEYRAFLENRFTYEEAGLVLGKTVNQIHRLRVSKYGVVLFSPDAEVGGAHVINGFTMIKLAAISQLADWMPAEQRLQVWRGWPDDFTLSVLLGAEQAQLDIYEGRTIYVLRYYPFEPKGQRVVLSSITDRPHDALHVAVPLTRIALDVLKKAITLKQGAKGR